MSHFDEDGNAKMVNVGDKDITNRTACAKSRVMVCKETFTLIKTGGIRKGNVLSVAQIAGIMGCKKTSELIPMCHNIPFDGVELRLELNEEFSCVDIEASVCCKGRTGVEMEALTAVSVAALTVYDMCKSVQKDIVITDIGLVYKSGGIHGDFIRREKNDQAVT